MILSVLCYIQRNSKTLTVYLNKIIYYNLDNELSTYMYSFTEPNEITSDGNLRIQTFNEPIKKEYSYQSSLCGLSIEDGADNKTQFFPLASLNYVRPRTCLE